LDLFERLRHVAAGTRPDVAPAGAGREVAQHRLLEPRPDDATAVVAQGRFTSVGKDLRDRDVVVGADADAVDALPLLAVHGELPFTLSAVVLAVRQQDEDLARLAIVLLRDVERVLERGADVGSEQRLRILLDPVEVERDRVEVLRQIREDQRAARESDEANAIDVLRLVLQERPDLLGRAREARRRHIVRAHRRRAIQHDDQILPLVLRNPRGQLRLRADEREDERAARDRGQREDRDLARPGGSSRETPEARRDRCQVALPLQVEQPNRARGYQDRQQLPPRRVLGPEEPHALADATRGLRARRGRAKQLHHLLRRGVRLLAQRVRQTGRQLEVELGVPVLGIRFDGLAELFLRAREPAETRFGRFFDEGLLEERARRPEVRGRLGGHLLREVDHLVEALQAVERPQVIADDAQVLGRDRLPDGG